VEAERAEVPAVRARALAVHVDVGDGRRSFEPNEDAFAGITPVELERAAIPASAAVIVVAAVFAVVGVPGVWQIDALPARIIEVDALRAAHVLPHETPAVVDQAINAQRRRGGTSAR